MKGHTLLFKAEADSVAWRSAFPRMNTRDSESVCTDVKMPSFTAEINSPAGTEMMKYVFGMLVIKAAQNIFVLVL